MWHLGDTVYFLAIRLLKLMGKIATRWIRPFEAANQAIHRRSRSERFQMDHPPRDPGDGRRYPIDSLPHRTIGN